MQPLVTSERFTPRKSAAEGLPLWEIDTTGEAPVLATAIHAGHALEAASHGRLALSDAERRREEDPGTDRLAELGVARVVVHRSRFEVDLNRPRDGAVYADPDAAWGLQVWSDGGPPAEVAAAAREEHDAFYAAMEELIERLVGRWGRIAVFDLHSYNHRRPGPTVPPEDPAGAPEINVGTGGLDRERWAPVVNRFMGDLRLYPFFDRHLDVRENVRFRGGYFPRWAARTFPETVCPLTIDVKKIYMDEWTGEDRPWVVDELRRALASTVPGVAQALREMDSVGPTGGSVAAAAAEPAEQPAERQPNRRGGRPSPS